jgi:hypothetical protein
MNDDGQMAIMGASRKKIHLSARSSVVNGQVLTAYKLGTWPSSERAF